MRRCQHFVCDERGAIAVEFALLIPIFIVLVMGVIEFGRGYNATIELTGAVREGARALALGDSETEARDAVIAASPGLDPAQMAFVIDQCTSGNERARITASYPVEYDIPFVMQGEWNISREAVMRCGG